jgi:cytochrome P450
MLLDTENLALTVPGPMPKTQIGHLVNLWRFSQDSIGFTQKLFQTYGEIASFRYGGGTNLYSPLPNCPGTVFVYGPEYVKQVATQHDVYYKYPLSGWLYRFKDESERTEPLKHFVVGLFGVNENQHRQHRQLMMPAFHKQRIERYRDDMIAITQSALDELRLGQDLDMAQIMRILTMRIATKTLFGEDIGSDGNNLGQLLQSVLAMLGSPQMMFLPYDIPGLAYHRFLSLIAELDNKMREMIAYKRSSDCKSHDVLSMLIEARDEDEGVGLSEDELLGHAGVIFAAGHETSSNALTWTLFLLSQHPQIMADLVDELQGVLNGEAPTIEQLAHLPLLDRVIKESMRVFSPVPWNGRVTSQPTELGNHVLPTGTEVFVSIYQTHQMAELYPEPNVFNPQRWETISPSIYEYNPFSAGSRLCIGAGFAMLEIKIVLAMLLQRYRLQFLPKFRIDPVGIIVLSSKYGMPMRIFLQDYQFAQGVGKVTGRARGMVKLMD